jgi:hypothetical protein
MTTTTTKVAERRRNALGPAQRSNDPMSIHHPTRVVSR